MMSLRTTASLLHDYFGGLAGLPGWDASTEFSIWLSLKFGAPCIQVREGNPLAKSERSRRRRIFVKSEYLLWFEMGTWDYSEHGCTLFSSALDRRESLRKAANRLQAQCLQRISLSAIPGQSVFEFDLGGTLVVTPLAQARPDDPMWLLYAHADCLTLRANGELEFGASASTEYQRLRAEPCTCELA